MKLSVSNIGWTAQQDAAVYSLMTKYGFEGLEIAPTRIFPKEPYDKTEQAAVWANAIRQNYGFVISSMQSIWFGRQERLFGSEEERNILINYTKRAIDFAATVGCKNLVFGCPGNRSVPENEDPESGIYFFRTIGDYAASKGTVIGMEANPPVYHTNYINDTASALELVESVNSSGFLLNLDVGTMIQNHESAEQWKGKVRLINHVHISEPGLKAIEKRELHQQLRDILAEESYRHFISIEMAGTGYLQEIETVMEYVKEIFGS